MYLIIVNPVAGDRAFSKIKPQLKAMLEQKEIEYEMEIAEDLSDVNDIIENSNQDELEGIIALGGNATANKTLNAMPKKQIAFGLIPVSQSNNLAEMIGVNSWKQAVDLLTKEPTTKKVYLGKIGEHYFINEAKIIPKRNLMSVLIPRNSWMEKIINWLGIKRGANASSVSTAIEVDDNYTLTGDLVEIHVDIIKSAKPKNRLQIEIQADADKNFDDHQAKFFCKKIKVDSELSQVVLVGNEQVAKTPVTIRGLQHSIPLIVPESIENED